MDETMKLITRNLRHVLYLSDLDFLLDALIDYPLSINLSEDDKQVVRDEIALRNVWAE